MVWGASDFPKIQSELISAIWKHDKNDGMTCTCNVSYLELPYILETDIYNLLFPGTEIDGQPTSILLGS